MACWNVIDHTEFSGAANYYEKTSIPSSYDHLYFVASARTDASGEYVDFCNWELNGDTNASNYQSAFVQAFTSSLAFAEGSTYTYGAQMSSASALASTFGVCEIWIPNYANTSNQKAAFTRSAGLNNSITNNHYNIAFSSGLWKSTAAINAFKFQVYGGSDDFVQYSTFTLYGINGAG
jgi:hypothetical protein